MKRYQRAIGSRKSKSKSKSNLNKANERNKHHTVTEIIVDPRKVNGISKDIICRSSAHAHAHELFNKFEFMKHNSNFFSKRYNPYSTSSEGILETNEEDISNYFDFFHTSRFHLTYWTHDGTLVLEILDDPSRPVLILEENDYIVWNPFEDRYEIYTEDEFYRLFDELFKIKINKNHWNEKIESFSKMINELVDDLRD